ncbi:MAG TPA: alpha/beta fold hydrolase [Polyangiaceae bacterium]|nr:alpha/beta fold hydrolase [Polyangiaceae bacterium]
MAQALVQTQKSTTGRTLDAEWKRIQFLVGSFVSPAMAERTAARLFLTPAGSARSEAENELLARARAFRVKGLAAWRWGSGPPVLLVHDWEGRGAQLGAFVSPLVARGFSVVTFDAPAHGASPGLRATVSDFANAVTAMSDRLGTPRAVVAHAFGALGSLVAVQRGVVPKALVLIAPPSSVERLASFQNLLDVPDDVLHGMRRRVERRSGASFDDVESASLVKGLTVPGLVVHDVLDREAPWRIGHDTARVWTGATLHTTKGLGHRRILKDAAVVERVTDFVAQAAR